MFVGGDCSSGGEASDPLLASPDENCLNYLSLLFRGRKKPRARRTNRRDERTVEDINLYLLPPSSPPPLSPPRPSLRRRRRRCRCLRLLLCSFLVWRAASRGQKRIRSSFAGEGRREEGKGGFRRPARPPLLAAEKNLRAGGSLKNERVDEDHHSLQTFIRLAYRMSPHLRSH